MACDSNNYKQEFEKVKKLLCQVCRSMDLRDDDSYLKYNPELRYWWDEHKEQERKRIEQEKKLKEEAKSKLHSIASRKKTYFKFLLDETLEVDDRAYFQRKFSTLEDEAAYILDIYPELQDEYKSNTKG